MKNKLIVFRGLLTKKSKFGVGKPIEFEGGHKGIIRSILDIDVQTTGDVFVVGKYRPIQKCVSCNGSGRYDSHGSPPCGACNGTGEEQ